MNVLFVFIFLIVQTNLIIDQKPNTSDVIIVPAGSLNGEREVKARDLLKEGYSKSGYIIPSPYSKEVERIFKQLEIDKDKILTETESTSTYTNAVNTLKIMKQKGFTSAIIVSSDYHMLRTMISFERVNKKYNYDYNFTYVPAYHEVNGELQPWYRAGVYTRYAATEEFFKVIGYFLGLYNWFDL